MRTMPEKQTIARVLIFENFVFCGIFGTHEHIAADSVGREHVPETFYSVLRLVFIIKVRICKVEADINYPHHYTGTGERLRQCRPCMHFVRSNDTRRLLKHSRS